MCSKVFSISIVFCSQIEVYQNLSQKYKLWALSTGKRPLQHFSAISACSSLLLYHSFDNHHPCRPVFVDALLHAKAVTADLWHQHCPHCPVYSSSKKHRQRYHTMEVVWQMFVHILCLRRWWYKRWDDKIDIGQKEKDRECPSRANLWGPWWIPCWEHVNVEQSAGNEHVDNWQRVWYNAAAKLVALSWISHGNGPPHLRRNLNASPGGGSNMIRLEIR